MPMSWSSDSVTRENEDVPPSRLVVNCRFLTRPVTGVERFAREITTHLAETVDDIVLVAPSTIEPGTRIAGREVLPVGRLRGHLWEQVSLPRYLRSLGTPMLLDLANTGPLMWRHQLYVLHDVAFITHPESYRPMFRLAYRIIAGTLVRRATRVATVSDFSRDEIVRVFGCPEVQIGIVPNAVSAFVSRPTGFDLPQLGNGRFFLAVGSAAHHKNTDTLMDAYANLRRQVEQPPSLVIVGGHSKGLRHGAASAERPGVIELGRVSDSQLAQLYAHATGFVYPSRYEGFGIPPLEAQAAGAPLVVSHRRPFTDLIEEGSALWCDPDDAASIAFALKRVAESPELRERLVENGVANAARYSWAESARRLLEIVTGDSRGE